jgi:ubiquinone/menaquinone biosynthesis C-methylase UbiE
MADLHDRLREFWDQDAQTYDQSPSHAATDPVEAAAWRAVLRRHLPHPPARVLDVGAGTGAMSLLTASMGYRVTALDLSPGMLERARHKAAAIGVPLDTIVAPATEPPLGRFDAVVERHVLWTAPEPAAALRAWRAAAPEGRLVVFEGIFSRESPWWRLRRRAADAIRPLLGVRHDHHAAYDPELLAALPLARAVSPAPLLRAVVDAGWRNVRIERLRDVEWARRLAAPWPLGWLETVPQFAISADA